MTTRPTLFLYAAVSGLLAACGPAASNDAPATPAPAGRAVDATPVATTSLTEPIQAETAPRPNEGYDWDSRLNDEAGNRSMVLAYEVSNTDAQPLNLSCKEGSRVISASTQTASVNVRSITLASAGVSRDYRVVQAGADEVGGGEYITVELASGDATLAAFQASGWMRLTVHGDTTDMAVQPGSGARQKIVAFMAFCNAQ